MRTDALEIVTNADWCTGYCNIWKVLCTQTSENVFETQTDSEGPDATARMHRLIWAFAVRWQNHWVDCINEQKRFRSDDMTARMGITPKVAF